MKMMRWLGCCLGAAMLWQGCIKDTNPPIPAYIYVEDVIFQLRDTAREGTASQLMPDAWVVVDGQLIGVDNLPCLLPVILDDTKTSHTVKIRAGILNNGIANKRVDYMLLTAHEETRQLQSGKIDTFRAYVHYDSSATIRQLEDFEGVGLAFSDDLDGNTTTKMARYSDDIFEGNFSGRMLVDSANLECMVATTALYAGLQPQGTAFPVYVEFNYKSDLPIQIGLIAHYSNGSTETHYKGGVNARGSWNKVYFDFTSDVYTLNASSYSIFFRVQNTSRLADPKVLIDNVKLLHY